MVDQLARDFASQPVVFLRQDVDRALGDRQSRWWAANTNPGSVYLPLVMADSGHAISNGPVDFANVYRWMVTSEAARPAGGALEAWWRPVAAGIRVYARVTNLSAVTLANANNAATVHTLAAEAAPGGGASTVRAAVTQIVNAPLAPGATATFTADVASVGGTPWDRLQAVVVADFRPGGSSGPFDVLQAAVAREAALLADPPAIDFGSVAGDAAALRRTVALAGPHVVTWTAAADVEWLQVTPASGGLPALLEVSVAREALRLTPQTGRVVITGTSADGMALTCAVTVTAARPGIVRRHLPAGS